MYSTIATALIIASVYTTIGAAAPTDAQSTPAEHRISPYINYLDSNNQLEWNDTPEGGRTAKVPFELISGARQELEANSDSDKLLVRGGKDAAVGGWTNMGQISDHAASYACIVSGEWAKQKTVQDLAKDSCKALVEMVPGAPVAQRAWNVYKVAKITEGTDGTNIKTILRWYYNSARAPQLTEDLCKTVYEVLTKNICVGTGDKKSSSRGGEIKIGDGSDYTMIGFDPNK
ncbi:MAG: hypothetical protein Q9186_001098 [Xanthomendoza sp. 1 TL-2023]